MDVGDPIAATDLNGDVLTYELEDESGGPFSIDSSGQISLGAGVSLDFEAPTEPGLKITATDPDGLSDAIEVEIIIADVNEPPKVEGIDDVEINENDARSIGRYTADDPEKDSFTWSAAGVDGRFFSMDERGFLTFKSPPDYEARADADRDNVYEATVTATDTDGNAGVLDVAITVKEINESPDITGPAFINDYAENSTQAVATYTAIDPESETSITWNLAGTDRGDFTLTNGVLSFSAVPDHEGALDSNRDNVCKVTVEASDSNNNTGRVNVDVVVTNVPEAPELTGPETIDDYQENSASRVATYSATDPEGGTITWSLLGADNGVLSLDSNGYLTFDEPPDFEARSNIYRVTVRASDGSIAAELGVTITVTNREEPGTVTLSAVQPQVETQLTATLADSDGVLSVTWQWYRASSPGSSGTAITNATSRFYTPVAADVGNYLRAVASCTDGHGSGKTAPAVTQNRVRAKPPPNRAPEFPSTETGNRSVPENTPARRNIGAPVAATDDDNDTLTYAISGSDADAFEIDERSGQLRTKEALDHETGPVRSVTVTATDPSGDSDTIGVTITIENVDETPDVTGETRIDYDEGTNTTVATYTATDPDGKGIGWSLSGTDGGDFSIAAGFLSFGAEPDYEEPSDSNRDNVYQVTIEASEESDGTSSGRLSVTVRVTNVEEPGTLQPSTSDPRLGQRMTVDLVDPDGGVSVGEWKWERSTDRTNWSAVSGANSGSYTPVREDVGKYLRVTAIYRDRQGSGKSAQSASTNIVRVGPVFSSGSATRSVRVDAPLGSEVRGPVQATHPDDEDLTYSLSGPDAACFAIESTTGQLLNYSSNSEEKRPYTVIVTARDQSGVATSITVEIYVSSPPPPPPPPPAATPEPPAIDSLTPGIGEFTVLWSAPDSDGGAVITAYDLRYIRSDATDKADAHWTVEDGVWTGSGSLEYVVTGLGSGTEYDVQVRAVNSVGDGSWSATVTGSTASASAPPPADPCVTPLGALTAATTRTGGWSSDCDSSSRGGSHAHFYSFTLDTGTTVTIELTSDVDTYLFLLQGAGRDGAVSHQNDDVAIGNTNSRIAETLSAGTYTIETATYSSGATGDFTLAITGPTGGATPPEPTPAPSPGPQPTADPCVSTFGTLTAAATAQGEWAGNCAATNRSESYGHFYSFTLDTGTTVTIELTSDADTYLFLLQGVGRDGAEVASNDDIVIGNTDSRISEALEAGAYTIEATTYNGGVTGSFTLAITGPTGGSTPPSSADNCVTPLMPDAAGSLVDLAGTWGDDCDSANQQGAYARYYSFSLSQQSEVTITTDSEVDTVLHLLEGTGRVGASRFNNDDIDGNNRNSRISETPDAGGYTIEVTTYSDAVTGDFTLTVAGLEAGTGEPPAADACLGELGTLTEGVTQTGSWTGDCTSTNREGRYARFYTFTLEEQGKLQIDLTSDTDPYLFLLSGAGTDGTVEAENDDIETGVNTNSRIAETLAAGTYTVEATTYSEGATGDFILSIAGPG